MNLLACVHDQNEKTTHSSRAGSSARAPSVGRLHVPRLPLDGLVKAIDRGEHALRGNLACGSKFLSEEGHAQFLAHP